MSITDFVAIYAGLVATGALIWNIIRDKPRVIVKVGPELRGSEDSYNFPVHVINKTQRPVNIRAIGLVLSDGPNYNFDPASHNLPILLPGDDRYTTWLEIKQLKEIRGKLSGFSKRGIIKFIFVEDATGKAYKGRIPWYAKKMINT